MVQIYYIYSMFDFPNFPRILTSNMKRFKELNVEFAFSDVNRRKSSDIAEAAYKKGKFFFMFITVLNAHFVAIINVSFIDEK